MVKGNKYTKKKAVTVKDVKRIVKEYEKSVSENKYSDITSTLASLDYNGQSVDVSSVAQGTTDSTRIGDQLKPTSLRLAYWLNGESFSSIVRVIVFRWLPDTGLGVPSVANILQHYGSALGVLSPFIHDTRSQFNILYDKVHKVSNSGGSELVHVDATIKTAKLIQYNAAGVTGLGRIYAIFITDRVLATSCTALVHARLNYIDN